MTKSPYPHLDRLLGGYFHQDCYDDGESDGDIVANYIDTQSEAAVAATLRDIERFVADHPTGMLTAFERAFNPSILIGENDGEAKDWLTTIASRLRQG